MGFDEYTDAKADGCHFSKYTWELMFLYENCRISIHNSLLRLFYHLSSKTFRTLNNFIQREKFTNTQNKKSSIWQLCRHWWHRNLSLRQLTNDNKVVKLTTCCFQVSYWLSVKCDSEGINQGVSLVPVLLHYDIHHCWYNELWNKK